MNTDLNIDLNIENYNFNDLLKLFNLKNDFSDNELILCTLPTPKQEKLANYIFNNSKNTSFVCILYYYLRRITIPWDRVYPWYILRSTDRTKKSQNSEFYQRSPPIYVIFL